MAKTLKFGGRMR